MRICYFFRQSAGSFISEIAIKWQHCKQSSCSCERKFQK